MEEGSIKNKNVNTELIPHSPPASSTQQAITMGDSISPIQGERLSTYKAFICSLMEYSSPLWAGSPA